MLPPGIVARVVVRVGAFNGFWRPVAPLAPSQRKHRFCVAVADLFHVLLGQIERLHDCDGGADVAPALFLVERTIGREQHVIRPEERQPANRRRARASERGVAVEGLEIVERPLLQPLQDERIILVRRARAQLIPAVRNAAFEIRNDAAEMVRDDFEVGEAVHDAGKDEPRHRGAGLERPADHAANFVFRRRLAAVVRHFARADRMQQDRLARLLDDLVDWEKLVLVDGGAVHIGVQLDRVGAVRQNALGLLGRRRGRVHGQRGGVADEAVGIFGDHLGKPVIAEPRPFGRMIGSGEPVDCRHAEADDLGVIGKGIDDPQPLLDVVERRNSPHPFAQILLSRGRLQHQFVDTLGKEMIERIDVTHVFNLLPFVERGRPDCVASALICILGLARAPKAVEREKGGIRSREGAMKRLIVGLLVLLSPSAFAQQSPPEIPYDSVANLLKLPPDMHLGEVAGVAVNSKGHIYVYSRGGSSRGPAYGNTASQILEFDRNGVFLREIGKNLYAWSFAHTVRVDKDDNIWATDKGSDMVIKFNPEGRVEMVFGRKSEASDLDAHPHERNANPPLPAVDGRFRQPTDVTWDPQGNIYIGDRYNRRIQVFDGNGTFKREIKIDCRSMKTQSPRSAINRTSPPTCKPAAASPRARHGRSASRLGRTRCSTAPIPIPAASTNSAWMERCSAISASRASNSSSSGGFTRSRAHPRTNSTSPRF